MECCGFNYWETYAMFLLLVLLWNVFDFSFVVKVETVVDRCVLLWWLLALVVMFINR